MAIPNNIKIKGTYLEPIEHGGIYGIFVDKKIIYIGYTTRPFKERFKEHIERINNMEKQNLSLYSIMTDYEKENYHFKILFDVEKIKYTRKINGPFTRQELKCIECAFIYLFKPKYNKSGNTEPYHFL